MTSSGYGTGTDNTGSSWPGSAQETSFNRNPPSSSGYDNSLLRQQQQSPDKHGDFTDINNESGVYTYIKGERRLTTGNVKHRPLPSVPQRSVDEKAGRTSKVCVVIVSMVAATLLVAGGVVIYLRLSCKIESFCSAGERSTDPLGRCKEDKGVIFNTDANFTCDLILNNPKTLFLTQPNGTMYSFRIIRNKLILPKTDFWQKVVVTVTIDKDSEDLRVLFTVKDGDCSIRGQYTITVSNSTNNISYDFTVKIIPSLGVSFCPCELAKHVGSVGEIMCNIVQDHSSILQITKSSVSSNSTISLFDSASIASIMENGQITREGITLTISEQEGGSGVRVHVYFPKLFCTDGGVYTFQVGNDTYKTVYNVKSDHGIPQITTAHNQQGGLAIVAEYEDSQELQCQAKIGCVQNPQLKLYHNIYDQTILDYSFKEMTHGMTLDPTPFESGPMLTLTHKFTETNLKHETHGKEFKCSYQDDDGSTIESEVFVATVLREDVCGDKSECNILHPYDCTKFVSCVTRPRESTCPGYGHFRIFSDSDCQGKCVTPKLANCKIVFDNPYYKQ